MTLINSEEFNSLINSVATALFALTMLWTVWFASTMD